MGNASALWGGGWVRRGINDTSVMAGAAPQSPCERLCTGCVIVRSFVSERDATNAHVEGEVLCSHQVNIVRVAGSCLNGQRRSIHGIRSPRHLVVARDEA